MIKNPFRSGCMGVLLSFLLAACVSSPQKGNIALGSRQQLYQVSDWSAEGKLGLRYDGKGNSAYFAWQNEGLDYQVQLNGPLGQGKVKLLKAGGLVSLYSDDTTETAASPEELLDQSLGWTLPISELVYWIKGVPAPDVPVDFVQQNDDGDIIHLKQMGWNIVYANYSVEARWRLPHKVTASRDDIRVILAIKRWSLALPPAVKSPH